MLIHSKEKKRNFPQEIAYIIGILTMALGVACVSVSNFGYSMIVAPAYLIYAKLDGLLSFGTAEYLLQGCLLILLCIVIRRFRWQYLLSFVTAVLYGYTFDFMLWLLGFCNAHALPIRLLFFAVGTLLISISVSLFVRTYLAPEVYELFVREYAVVHTLPFGQVKLVYDCISCLVSILLSLILFGGGVFADFSFSALGQALLNGCLLEGIGIGTVIAALVNGPLITLFGGVLDRHFTFTRVEKAAKILQVS